MLRFLPVRAALVFAVGLLILSGWSVFASANTIYLPIAIRSVPSPTPVPTHTPPATSTPVPTSTPVVVPTASPSPVPTEQPTGIHVLGTHSHYVDSLGYLHIVGEVENRNPVPEQFVKVAANLYNASGQLVATDFTYTTLDVVPTGERACFHMIISDAPADWARYQFEPITYSEYSETLPQLTLLSSSGSVDATFGWYEMIGEVHNDHDRRVEYVQPVATLYDGSGRVVGCDFTYVNSTHLDPGQSSAFEMTVTGRDSYTDVASYRIQIDGND